MHGPWWYSWGGLNQSMFLAINHAGNGWLWNHLALWGTAAGDHTLFPIYAALTLALALKRPNWLAAQAVLVFLVGYVIDWGIVSSIKPWLDFPRPAKALGEGVVHVLGRTEYFHSFPSGHAAFAFVLTASLVPGAHWVLKVILVLFALWVGWSRMAVGAHFPADVLGGALIGVFAAWLSAQALRLAGYARVTR